jgi:hypothetical protein
MNVKDTGNIPLGMAFVAIALNQTHNDEVHSPLFQLSVTN